MAIDRSGVPPPGSDAPSTRSAPSGDRRGVVDGLKGSAPRDPDPQRPRPPLPLSSLLLLRAPWSPYGRRSHVPSSVRSMSPPRRRSALPQASAACGRLPSARMPMARQREGAFVGAVANSSGVPLGRRRGVCPLGEQQVQRPTPHTRT
jgi:hypothetical protein